MLPFEDAKARQFSLIGLDSDSTLWNLTTVDCEKADLAGGFYISTLCEAIYGVHKGDQFTFRHIATLEEHTVTIDGVIKNGYQSYLISSRKKAADIAGLDSGSYNVILAEGSLPLETDKISEIISDTTYPR